ncbi:MAG: hypothetical protein IKI75_03955 [Lachnospiraceae bacterium]|nr:hypothetical protein [Lachnospiraceae bacterium]
MVTDTIMVYSSGSGMSEAMDTAERFGLYHKLSSNDSNVMRLLTEELLGMVKGITGNFEGEFWLESDENEYRIHLKADTYMDKEKKKELMSLSASGKNETSVGFWKMLGKAVGNLLLGSEDDDAMAAGPVFYGGMGSRDVDALSTMEYEWSLINYRKEMAENEEEDAENWDELEKSVVMKLADDVRVGIRGDIAELTIVKKF